MVNTKAKASEQVGRQQERAATELPKWLGKGPKPNEKAFPVHPSSNWVKKSFVSKKGVHYPKLTEVMEYWHGIYTLY